MAPGTKKLVAFFVPFSLMLLSICSVQPPPSYSYRYLKTDCAGQGSWICQKLYSDSSPCTLAFFGTSHTLQAVNDSLLSQHYMPCLNLGYCRFGRDIQYELFRQALQQKKIKSAIFEISETEASYSHPVYPYLAEGSDVFIPAFLFNQDFYHNRAEAFLFRLSYLRYWFSPQDSFKETPRGAYGFIPSFGKPSESYLAQQKNEKLKDLDNYNDQGFVRKAELSFSHHYFKKIQRLANENDCRVFLLYLPAYGNRASNSLDSNFYSNYFEILIPPDSILNDFSHWHDEAHLNNQGATKLSLWLSDELASKQKRGRYAFRTRTK